MRFRISAVLFRRLKGFPSTIPEEPLLGLLLPEVGDARMRRNGDCFTWR